MDISIKSNGTAADGAAPLAGKNWMNPNGSVNDPGAIATFKANVPAK
jgi:hypothetical protein